jgi:F-type H+-transporting ATPase subunit gamma
MANVLDLRRRIRSVKNTRQITKAMKMVSAARLRRAQDRAMSARPYAQMLTSVLKSLMRRIELVDPESGDIRHPLLVAREEKHILFVVVSGEKGFAGAFNANIMKSAQRFLDEKRDAQIDLEPIGRKGRDLLRKRHPIVEIEPPGTADGENIIEWMQHGDDQGEPRQQRERISRIEVTGDHPGIFDNLSFEKVNELTREICERYAHEEIDAAYIVYNEFASVIAQRVVVERILPITEIGERDVTGEDVPTPEERARAGKAAATAGVSLQEPDVREAQEEAEKFGTAEVDYIYEQSPRELLNSLMPRYVATHLYHALLESVASEHAARMTAMDSATNNAAEMIDSYTLQMNRVRQAAITREIIEIVSGAAAL